jgi:sialic acid synthase SpsE
MVDFNIGCREIGKESPIFIVAEIGANHNGDPLLAKEMIKAAAAAAVDAVKFQIYTSASLLADADRIISWGPPGKEKSEPIGEMFDRLALPPDSYEDLFSFAKSLGLIAFATPFSIEEAHFLAELNVPCYKIASSDVSYLDLLREVARYRKPILLSLGKSTLGEVDEAIRTLLSAGCEDLALLHCVAQYPAPINEMNLRTISALSAIYPECVVGLSDHSLGITPCLGAIALGAKIVEKHFTLDHHLEGPDHWFSSDLNEMRQLVKEVRLLESALGQPGKGILPCEKQERVTSTRSLVLKTGLKAGTAVTEENLKIVRPGWGIHPHDKEKIIGLKVQYDLPTNTVLKWDHFR